MGKTRLKRKKKRKKIATKHRASRLKFLTRKPIIRKMDNENEIKEKEDKI